jgi:NADH-quinone oxidoreductase subunit G
MADQIVETIPVTIDGVEVRVPKGTLAIRAAEMAGIAIPRFCDHPLLDPVGACRQCMVEVPDAGNGRGFPMPQAACTLATAPGMQIKTQLTSEMAKAAQVGIQELILINHPLDCPICDKGGECPLQNQAYANGRTETRYEGAKRQYPKPLPLSAQIGLDRERCILCARCTRFAEQIAGDPLIALAERGAVQQVGLFADEPFNSYFSGNVVQLCPVGALTATSYRFTARPFDLVSTDTTCEGCAAGCSLRADHRHFEVRRRLAGANPEVNEEWNCDKGRFAFVSARGDDRLKTPLVRRDGELRPASWPEAVDAAVAGLRGAKKVGVITGGRLTVENAYGYAKFARVALGTNNIDFRTRPASAEEAGFLADQVAGKSFGQGVTYEGLEKAKQVVLVCFEPEDEAPIVFLRLRKAVRKKKLKVLAIAALRSYGCGKLNAELLQTAPGDEAAVVAGLKLDADSVVLVGERAASVPGLLSAVVKSCHKAGAKLAWIPRRAGDRGAVEAGCLPNLLPGGRPVAEASARVDVAAAWGVELPAEAGLDAEAMLACELDALVVGGANLDDFASAKAARRGVERAGFVVSLEQRASDVTELADVVFPVALIEDQSGTFLNWEHRPGRIGLVNPQATNKMTDLRVLAALADALGKPLGARQARQAAAELAELGVWGKPVGFAEAKAASGDGQGLRVASWRLLLDNGRSQDGEANLKQTARQAVAKLSPADAGALGLSCGDIAELSGPDGAAELPVAVADGLAEGVVVVPANSGGFALSALGVAHGGRLSVSKKGGK